MSNSSIQIGTITEVKNANGTAKVKVDGRVTDWLPVIAPNATKSKKSFSPSNVGDQVLILNPHGSNRDGFILKGLYHDNFKPPSGAGDDTEVVEFGDGTVVTFDINGGELKIDSPSKLNIICSEATVKADKVLVDSSDISLGEGGQGVITAESICPYTNAPHSDASSTVKATK